MAVTSTSMMNCLISLIADTEPRRFFEYPIVVPAERVFRTWGQPIASNDSRNWGYIHAAGHCWPHGSCIADEGFPGVQLGL